MKKNVSHLKIIKGVRQIPVRLKFLVAITWLSLRFRKQTADRGLHFKDIFAVKKIRHDMLQLTKFVQWGKGYYFSTETPLWPSGPWRTVVKNGGLNLMDQGTERNRHINLAVLAITSVCGYRCAHCYEQHNLNAASSVPLDLWKKTIRSIQDHGAGIIAISGGEPMQKLAIVLELLETGDTSASEFHLFSSGYGVTDENARQLRKAGLSAAAIGFDNADRKSLDTLRGTKGAFDAAINAIQCFRRNGIFVYVNVCLTKSIIQNNGLWNLLETAKNLDVGIVRLLEPKPCGGYFSRSAEALFDEKDRAETTRFFLKANNHPHYARHPLVSYVDYAEAPERLGCGMGGLSHFHIDSSGNVNPCVFIPVSFGNIMREDFGEIFKRMRSAVPHTLHKPCPSITLADTFGKARSKGGELPIPINSIKSEWKKMFS